MTAYTLLGMAVVLHIHFHMPQQAVYLLQEIFAIKYRLNKQKVQLFMSSAIPWQIMFHK